MEPKTREFALLAHPRIGQPDRRHQVTVRENRQHLRVDPVGLAGKPRQPLDLLSVRDLDLPALCFPGCRGPDERRSSTRQPVDRLAVHLLDAPGEPPQRVDVGWNGELVEMLPVVGEQTNIELLSTEIESSVQHVKRGLLGARLVDTAERFTNGGRPSWQSLAGVCGVDDSVPGSAEAGVRGRWWA
jgi:hypothetical protein